MCKKGMMMTAVNELNGVAVIFKTRCKMWSCADCAKINSDLWVMKTIVGTQMLMEQNKMSVEFVTVTSHENLDANGTIAKLPHQWDALRKRMQRACPGCAYIIVPERHRDGRVHIHGVFLCDLKTRWFKDNARQCGMGYKAEAEIIRSASFAGFYVGKYISKQLYGFSWPKGFHRVRTSHGWPKVEPLARPDEYRFIPLASHQTIQAVTKNLAALGYQVALADDRASWHVLKTSELTDGASWLTMGVSNI